MGSGLNAPKAERGGCDNGALEISSELYIHIMEYLDIGNRIRALEICWRTCASARETGRRETRIRKLAVAEAAQGEEEY